MLQLCLFLLFFLNFLENPNLELPLIGLILSRISSLVIIFHCIIKIVPSQETTKPYLVTVMRVAGLHTMLLLAHTIDANGDCSRLVIDNWLDIRLGCTDGGMVTMAIPAVALLGAIAASILTRLHTMRSRPRGQCHPVATHVGVPIGPQAQRPRRPRASPPGRPAGMVPRLLIRMDGLS
jgi:hypothetical protein